MKPSMKHRSNTHPTVKYSQMNSVPKLSSCSYADCWTKNHFSTEFGVSALNLTHLHTLLWGVRFKVVRESAVHGLQEGHRNQNRPGNLHQKEKALHRNVWCFFVLPAVYLNDPFREKSVCRCPQAATNAFYFTMRPSAF